MQKKRLAIEELEYLQAEEPAGVGPSPTSLLVLQGRVDNVQACLETLLNGISGAKDSRIFSHDHV